MKLYEKIRRPPFFMRATHWITDEDHPVKAGPNARSAVIVPILLMQLRKAQAGTRATATIRSGRATRKGGPSWMNAL